MKRCRLIVRGNVQAVGYRAFVKMIARNMQIHGSARNLDDGSVEIYCECPEETYEKFKASIDRKASDPMDPIQMNVTEIEEEEDVEIDENLLKYPFDVLYDGMEIPPLEKEALERSEMAILAMTSMNTNLSGKIDHLGDKMDRVAEKVDAVGEKVERNIEETRKVGEKVEKNIEETKKVGEKADKGFEELGKKVDAVGEKVDDIHLDLAGKLEKNTKETELFRSETKEEFASLDSKYHVVSERLLSMDESSKLIDTKLVESVEELKKVVQKFLER